MRHASMKTGLAAAALLLSACAPEKEEPACCAIEPKAKCESQLHGAGISRAEFDALKAEGGACPSPAMSEARIREIAKAADTPECRAWIGQVNLSKLDSGACAVAPAAVTDGPAPH